jgi:hypothetical protein
MENMKDMKAPVDRTQDHFMFFMPFMVGASWLGICVVS